MLSGAVRVSPLDGTREEGVVMAGRIDDDGLKGHLAELLDPFSCELLWERGGGGRVVVRDILRERITTRRIVRGGITAIQ
jgi:hypothetical protein